MFPIFKNIIPYFKIFANKVTTAMTVFWEGDEEVLKSQN